MACTDQCLKPTGPRQAHCAVCHTTFTGPTWFDLHRIGGHCVPVKGLVTIDGLTATPAAHANRERLRRNEHGFRKSTLPETP